MTSIVAVFLQSLVINIIFILWLEPVTYRRQVIESQRLVASLLILRLSGTPDAATSPSPVPRDAGADREPAEGREQGRDQEDVRVSNPGQADHRQALRREAHPGTGTLNWLFLSRLF